MAQPLRIVFAVVAIVSGIALMAAGVFGLLDLAQPVAEAPDLDSPPPFSFSTYGYAPVMGIIAQLSALAALRRQWDALMIVSLFMLGAVLVGALDEILRFEFAGVIPALGVVWMVLLPAFGLVTAAMSREQSQTAKPSSSHERIRLRNTLVGLAVLGYLWRAVTLVVTPETASVIGYFRGTSGPYLILGSMVGIVASAVLLFAVILLKGNERFLSGALAFTAGVSFEGFLHALDLTMSPGAPLEVVYSLQDAVAFLACGLALALSAWSESKPSQSAA